MSDARPDITALLHSWSQGDHAARETLIQTIYPELKSIARSRRHKSNEPIMQTTEIVNEAYLKLLDQRTSWTNRAHFLAIAATLMRRIVLDAARSRRQMKHGGDQIRVTLDETIGGGDGVSLDWLAIDDSLNKLSQASSDAAQLVELRVFAGMTLEDAAEAMGIGRTTAVRKWRLARAWLADHLA